MTFAAENDLERALVAAASDDASRQALYRLLLDTKVFVLGEMVGADANREMLLVSARNGESNFHLAFSSLTRLKGFAGAAHFLQLSGRDLFTAVPGGQFYLNPGIEYGRELPADEMAGLLARTPARSPIRKLALSRLALDKADVRIGALPKVPVELVDPLKAAFDARTDVSAAHLVLGSIAGDPPHFIIGIETTGDWDAVGGEVERFVAQLMPGQPVDIVAIDRPGDALTAALLSIAPFYSRKRH